LRDRDEFLKEIRERLLLAQDVMKASHDKKRRDLEFSVGDWVWLRLHHRTAVGITSSISKLAPRFYGTFQVIARIGDVAYRLQLPEKARIHNVFHVGLLKKFIGDPPAAAPVPLPPIVHGRVLPTPSKILRARLNRGVWELLIHWEGRARYPLHSCSLSQLLLVSPLRTPIRPRHTMYITILAELAPTFFSRIEQYTW